MTQDDKKFLEWWKTRWLGNQHNIKFELIDEAKMLMGVEFKTSDRWEMDNTVKIIHNHGIQLLQQVEMETRYTNFIPEEEKSIPVTIAVPQETFEQLEKSETVEFIPINKRKKNVQSETKKNT